MRHTIIALFNTHSQAEEAYGTLIRSGFAPADIDLHAQNAPAADTLPAEGGVLASAERFLSSLFASTPGTMDTQRYTDAVQRGAVLVSVRAASGSHAELARNALTQLGALDVSERESAWNAPDAPDAARSHSVLDELGVGAPARTTGPVPSVTAPLARDTLPGEPVPPPPPAVAQGMVQNDELTAQAAVAAAGTPGAGGTIEDSVIPPMYAGSINAGLAGTDSRPAEAADTQTPGTGSTATSPQVETGVRQTWRDTNVPDEYLEFEEDFRSHYDDVYGDGNVDYKDYQPAYQHGANMAHDQRYWNRPWEEIEPDAQREWEAISPDSPWERFKIAIRHGWNRVTGHRPE